MRVRVRGIAVLVILTAVAAAGETPPPTLAGLLEEAAKLPPAKQSELVKPAVVAARGMIDADAVVLLAKAAEQARPLAAAVAADLLGRGRAEEFKLPLRAQASKLAPVLADTGRVEAVDLLLALLPSELPHVRRPAIRALGGMSGFSGRIVPALVDAWPRAKSEDERKDVLWAAVRLPGGPSAWFLAKIALSEQLECLASVFDPGFRPDVLLRLIPKLPKSHAALFRLTGKNFGMDDEEWRDYVNSFTPRSRPREGGVPKPKKPVTGKDQTFFGLTLPAGDLVFLIDASSSMNEDYKGRKLIDVVKDKVIELLSGLGSARRFNVVFFASGAKEFRRHMVYARPGDVRLASRFIRKFKAQGGTNLEAGLRRALADENVTDIVLLSDGLPNRGSVRRAYEVKALLGKRKVRIHTISNQASFRLMKGIAKQTGGRSGVL